MKRLTPITVFSIVMLLFSNLVLAQQAIRSNGFDFQGYARNVDGSAVSSQAVQVRFSIFTSGNAQPFGSNAFDEQQTLTTDPFGIFTAEIGSGNADFENLSFENFDYFLKVEVSVAGGNFIEISNKQLRSVPYAQAAGNGVPSGTILPFGGDEANVPAGYLACKGQTLDPNDPAYANLFAAIGYNWGREGNDFRVPELRGWFLRGWNGATPQDPNADDRYALLADGATGNNVGSYQNGATAMPVLGFNVSPNGGHGHELFKEKELLMWYKSNTDDNIIDHRNYDAAGKPIGGTRLNPFATGSFSVDGGGSDYHLAGINLTGLFMQEVADHIHDISGGDAETRGRNASVLYIIKL